MTSPYITWCTRMCTHSHTKYNFYLFSISNLTVQQLKVGDTNQGSLCAGHLLQHTIRAWHSNPHGKKDETKMYACAHTGTGTHTHAHTSAQVHDTFRWEQIMGTGTWLVPCLPPTRVATSLMSLNIPFCYTVSFCTCSRKQARSSLPL